MAQIVLGAIGAGIGAVFGDPMLGFSAGVTAAGILFPPSQKGIAHGKLADLRVTSAQYGVALPQVWGNFRLGGNIIWSTDLVEHVNNTKGGKGGGGKPSTRTYTYTVSVAVAFARAPYPNGIQSLDQVYAEDVKIYDRLDATVINPCTMMTVYNGEETQPADPTMSAHGVMPAYRGVAYVVFQDLDLTQFGGRMPALTFVINGGSTATSHVSDILTDIFTQAGLTAGQFDVTAGATTVVSGFALSQRRTAALQISELLRAYNFELVEVDSKLKIVALGGSSQITVSSGDLGTSVQQAGDLMLSVPTPVAPTHSSSSITQPAASQRVKTTRMHDLELPQRLELSYFSKTALYNLVTRAAVRYVKTHQNKGTLNFPLVLTDTLARQIVETLLYRQWVERESFEFVLPLKYLLYCPSDILTLPVGGQTLRVRLQKMDFSLFGPVQCVAVLDDLTVLTQSQTSDDPVIPSITSQIAGTTLTLISTNALQDADALSSGFYYGAAGSAAGLWPGCVLYWSRDGGTTYQILATILDPLTYGTCTTTLAAPPAGVNTGRWDTVSTITTTITAGDDVPTTTTDADVLSGANACLVGNEVIQFAVATNNGDGTYTLSRLLRGRRGTDVNWGGHGASETFVMLQFGAFARQNLDESYRGKTIFFKPVTSDGTLAGTSAQSLIITGNEWTNYMGCQAKGARDGGLNLTITWKRRTRSGGEMRDMHDVDLPASDTPESYDVEIMSGTGGGATVKRTFSALASPSVVYSAANQTTDFGGTQTSVNVKIYQNGKYGRGYTYRVSV